MADKLVTSSLGSAPSVTAREQKREELMAGIQLNYTEKDVEDILEAHCEHYLGLKYVARQFRSSAGIVDIIAKHPEITNRYYIIELKRGTLDASAFTQAMRYSAWFNSELSKHGKRVFFPILIGEALHSDLNFLCHYFDRDEYFGLSAIYRVAYRLFDFDPLNGVTFNYHSVKQRDSRDLYAEMHCHIAAIEERLEYCEFDGWSRLRAAYD